MTTAVTLVNNGFGAETREQGRPAAEDSSPAGHEVPPPTQCGAELAGLLPAASSGGMLAA
jgi:hypothetical protein